jgi:hypothetical protein
MLRPWDDVRGKEHPMRITLWLSSLAGLLLSAGAAAQDGLRSFAETLRARAAVVKQTPAQLRWQEIPWLTDLSEGLRLARQEKRPLLLWTTGDEPLGRC